MAGRDKVTGIIDVDAAELYFREKSPIAPATARRVTNLRP
jgi:hypothetical protein